MNKIELVPKYSNEAFSNKAEFNSWLKKTTFKTINLMSLGQDLTKIYVAESGEILHCNFHANIYNGKFINIDKLSSMAPIIILENGLWVEKKGLLVEEIL